MAVCVHGEVCRLYWNRYGIILSRKCPFECPFFEEKKKERK